MDDQARSPVFDDIIETSNPSLFGPTPQMEYCHFFEDALFRFQDRSLPPCQDIFPDIRKDLESLETQGRKAKLNAKRGS